MGEPGLPLSSPLATAEDPHPPANNYQSRLGSARILAAEIHGGDIPEAN